MRDGEVHSNEVHQPGAGERGAQVLRLNIKGQVAPVQTKRGDAGVLHRRRRGMFDWMAENGAIAGAGVDWVGEGRGHARVYRGVTG